MHNCASFLCWVSFFIYPEGHFCVRILTSTENFTRYISWRIRPPKDPQWYVRGEPVFDGSNQLPLRASQVLAHWKGLAKGRALCLTPATKRFTSLVLACLAPLKAGKFALAMPPPSSLTFGYLNESRCHTAMVLAMPAEDGAWRNVFPRVIALILVTRPCFTGRHCSFSNQVFASGNIRAL